MADLEKAKREIRFAKMTADSRSWDQLEPKLQSIEAALDGVPEADKAPIAAEVAAMRKTMNQAVREEKSGRIEREIQRSCSSAEDDFKRGYTESATLQKAADRLASAEAKEVLTPEQITKLQALIDATRDKGNEGVKAEKAGKIEREIQRTISAGESELKSGYVESPQLTKAQERLTSAEAREVLSADTIAKYQAQIASLQPKAAKPAPPPPPPKAQPAAAAPLERPKAQPAPVEAAPPPPPVKVAEAPAMPVISDQARSIENDILRSLKFGSEEIERNPMAGDNYLNRLHSRMQSDDVKQHLAAATIQNLQTQVDAFQARSDFLRKAEKARVLGEFIGKFITHAEEDISHNRRQSYGLLTNATERLKKDDVKEFISVEAVAKFRSEIVRVTALVDAATKADGLSRAHPILKELEERVTKPIFTEDEQAWQTMGTLEGLKTKVRGAMYEIPKDDKDVKAIEGRIGKVDTIIAKALAQLDRDQSFERVKQSWELEEKAIEGWEDEKDISGQYELPTTTLAVRRLTWFVNDKELQAIGDAQKKDKPIQALIAGANKVRDAAIKKLNAAFNALLAKMEKEPRPSNRVDLEKPYRLNGSAGSDFEGTPHKEENSKRALALAKRWEKEIEAERKARQAKYDELSAVAAKAWPKILAGIECEKEFDPSSPRSNGKRVLIQGLRNRIGWDFSAPVHFAIWVNGFPVFGNYDKTVTAAVEAAIEKTGLCLDDHTDWDAVIVVGGPGKVKLRTEVIVKNSSNLEIGKFEEWRPVDAVSCTVVALRAGPVAVGPRG